MHLLKDFSDFLETIIGVESNYILLFLYTIFTIVIIKLITKILIKIYDKFSDNERKIYIFNKKTKIVGTVTIFILLLLIWETHLQNFIYLISFISAGIALSLKDIILNFFSGIYIRLKKPFDVEDRVVVNEIEGDVVNINTMNFEVLEISNREDGEQSTGVIINIPNSVVFTTPIKNYTKVFKYIWNEITVKIPLDSNVKKVKSELYRIVNTNEVIQQIPNKMENQINNAITDYRIFYNKLKPIIYTKVVDDHIELSVRYLVHPKKARNVESDIWNKILASKEKIELFK